MPDTILVTGGAGFIGSHTGVELLASGCEVVVLDDFSNSRRSVPERMAELGGRRVTVVEADIQDRAALDRTFSTWPIRAVIHFAGLKAVADSVRAPLGYYRTNVAGTMTLLEAMAEAGCRSLVFSSSATVYGVSGQAALPEAAPLRPTSPYGRTKLFVEELLRDLAASDPAWHIGLLRYFNPVGAHPSGLLGEDPPLGLAGNLMPLLLEAAAGGRPLEIHGRDYPTQDGTCIRDYIHVQDVARGHLALLDALPELPGAHAFNLGTGRGRSVLEVLAAVEALLGRPVPHRFGPRRPGDVPSYVADPALAERRLGWKASRDLRSMCEDAWRFRRNRPD